MREVSSSVNGWRRKSNGEHHAPHVNNTVGRSKFDVRQECCHQSAIAEEVESTSRSGATSLSPWIRRRSRRRE